MASCGAELQRVIDYIIHKMFYCSLEELTKKR